MSHNHSAGIQAEQWLAEELISRVVNKALGRVDPECAGNYPRDVYFIGNLRPKPTEKDEADRVMNPELANKLAPVAFGLEAKVALGPENEVEMLVTVEWSVYYRAFPSYADQRRYQASPRSAQDGEDDSESEAAETPTEQDDTFALRFKKVRCLAQAPITIRRMSDGTRVVDCDALEGAIREEHARAKSAALEDPDIFRCKDADAKVRVRVPSTALDSPESYRNFCSSLGQPVEPCWAWELVVGVHDTLDGPDVCLVSLDLVNVTPGSARAENQENFLFDSKLCVQFRGGRLVPFEMILAPRGFREDSSMWGRGHNCAVYGTEGCTLETTHVPVFRQMRLQGREIPEARFADLAKDPIPVLQTILTAMQDYNSEWEDAIETYRLSPDWNPRFEREFQNDWDTYRDEIARFAAGLDLLRNSADVCFAFRLTNQVFSRLGRSSWRLFQIVYLVTQLRGIVTDKEDDPERRVVDIIYYPTGGGKTEAYLGAIVFSCFWDRLRGKTAGVTAWARFPLRLLTVQQMQRVADIIGVAELVRREQDDPRLHGSGVDGFAVGYFVGEGGTPNEIVPPRAQRGMSPFWLIAVDPSARNKLWKTIARCPACRTASVEVDFDETTIRLIHRCTNPGCPFPKGIIPVYVVDNEIFRYLPSVIVGTIDKLALFGLQRKLSLLLGKVTGRCPKHGYYNYKCCQKGCTVTNLPKGAPSGISGPTLFVQDELHLLREGLGTFDSHYETLIQHLLVAAGAKAPLKVMASSATIEAFERQVEHLYGRKRAEARVFPGPGPKKGTSFYAQSLDYPQRIYVGVLPHNKTLFNAILEMIEYYHRAIADVISEAQAGQHENLQHVDANVLLDLYTTSLTYFLANRELNAIRTDINNNVNENLQQSRYSPLCVSELTGAISTDEVTATLEKVSQQRELSAEPQAILATSMISHGVDVDRFNAMLFCGMPRQNSEYVQASSRVGRTHLGIVFTCLHPARERDQSHYTYFVKYHEFLGQMIEPVSINRWSKFSMERTLPGIFTSILLQELSDRVPGKNPDRFYMFDAVKRMIAENEITIDDVLPRIKQAYQLDQQASSGAQDFLSRVEAQLRRILYDQIGTNSAPHQFVSEALDPKPMRSLREVDEQLEIVLDHAGSEWARTTGGK